MQAVNFNANGHNWKAHWRDEADESVFNEIFKLDEYRAAKDVIKNAKDPIVDVGAHAGFFTMYCRALNDRVKIFAVEPEANNLDALARHLRENKIKGVKVIAGALAQVSGKRQLLISADSHNHRLDVGQPLSEKSAAVAALSFSDFCRQNKIKRVSLLKIDIEGGEYEMFAGMTERDFSMVDFVILEYHMGREYKQIEDKLRAVGFGVQIFPSHFDKTMGFIWARNKRAKL